ncbi:hypothetical protein DMENIID0001_076070 [Sergentomyia squamirostris]
MDSESEYVLGEDDVFIKEEATDEENSIISEEDVHLIDEIKEEKFEVQEIEYLEEDEEIVRNLMKKMDEKKMEQEEDIKPEKKPKKKYKAKRRPQQCAECGKVYSSMGDLNVHRELHSGQKPHKCAFCNKCFAKASYLNRHMVTHSKGCLTCDVCEKQFPNKFCLFQHRKRHFTERAYICSYCDQEFVYIAEMKRHIYTHHLKRKRYELTKKKKDPVKCPECNKVFYENYLLKSHMSSHREEKPFQCSECEKTFKKKSDCDRHQRQHTIRFACDTCGKIYARKDYLRRHQKVQCKPQEEEIKLVEVEMIEFPKDYEEYEEECLEEVKVELE